MQKAPVVWMVFDHWNNNSLGPFRLIIQLIIDTTKKHTMCPQLWTGVQSLDDRNHSLLWFSSFWEK